MVTENDPGLEGDELNTLPEGVDLNRHPSLSRNVANTTITTNARPDDLVKKGEHVQFGRTDIMDGELKNITRIAAKDFTLAQLGESIRAIRKDGEMPPWSAMLLMLVNEGYVAKEQICSTIVLYIGEDCSSDLEKVTFKARIPDVDDEDSTLIEINLD